MIGTQRSCSRLLLFPGHLSGHVGVRSRNKWSGKNTAHVGLFKEADLAEREMCRGKEIKGSYECRKGMFILNNKCSILKMLNSTILTEHKCYFLTFSHSS